MAMAKTKKGAPPKRNGVVFTPYFRHYRTGQIVRPKTAKAFCFPAK